MQLFRIKFTADPQLDSEGFCDNFAPCRGCRPEDPCPRSGHCERYDSPLRNITQADRNIINELWPNESRRERCSMGQYEQQAARCDRERCEGCIPNEVCYCEQTYKAPVTDDVTNLPMPWCERCQCWHHHTAPHIGEASNPPGWQHAEGLDGVIVALPPITWADMDQMDLDRAHAAWLATGKDLRQYADRRVKDRRTPRR